MQFYDISYNEFVIFIPTITRARVGLWSIVGLVHVRRGQCEAFACCGGELLRPELVYGPCWVWSMLGGVEWDRGHVGPGPS